MSRAKLIAEAVALLGQVDGLVQEAFTEKENFGPHGVDLYDLHCLFEDLADTLAEKADLV